MPEPIAHGKYIKIDGLTYRQLKPRVVKPYKLNDAQKHQRTLYMRGYRATQKQKKLRGCLACAERAAAAAVTNDISMEK